MKRSPVKVFRKESDPPSPGCPRRALTLPDASTRSQTLPDAVRRSHTYSLFTRRFHTGSAPASLCISFWGSQKSMINIGEGLSLMQKTSTGKGVFETYLFLSSISLGRKSWTSFVCMFDVYVCMFKILDRQRGFEHTYMDLQHTYKTCSRFAPSRI